MVPILQPRFLNATGGNETSFRRPIAGVVGFCVDRATFPSRLGASPGSPYAVGPGLAPKRLKECLIIKVTLSSWVLVDSVSNPGAQPLTLKA